MYLCVEGPAPAYSAKFTSTKPSFRKCLPPFSSYKYSLQIRILRVKLSALTVREFVNCIVLTIRIDILHLHVSKIPELALAFILQGKENRAEYLTQ